MSTPSQPLCIGMINLCIKMNSYITLHTDNSHLDSWIVLWHNQHNIFVYLPNHQHTIISLPEALSKMLIPFLLATQIFMHCGPGGAWIDNHQSNPTQKLFVVGVLMTYKHDPSSSQKPNVALRFFTWYLKILFIIQSFQKQDFKLKLPKEYDCSSHSQCQLFTPTTPASNSAHPLYPAVFSLSSKKKLIQLASGSEFPMINTPLPHQKNVLAFLWDQENPNGQSIRNLWANEPPISTFNARHIITNKVVSSFKSLLSNNPLGGLLLDDMELGKTIKANALIVTSKERLITNPHCSTPTSLNHQLAITNIKAFSSSSTAIQHLPWPHLSLIIQVQNLKM
ncbi:hypothetical protein O181_050798 [Austropuccinia psidii MF-1]|uniref:Uncharacterized protein n=1 Tax=Austropuccinia psidii MF-1 TaxID=1389203 RepID=A0A9Q3DZS2_9BASI|nr:hypothetical protein [Austropuccinia psidii MF-1]